MRPDSSLIYTPYVVCGETRANHVIGGRARTKHIDISKHFAHENGPMRLYKIATEFPPADMFRYRIVADGDSSCDSAEPMRMLLEEFSCDLR